MSETRKLAAILVADVVGYSRLAGVDEDRTLARLRGLRSDLIDPAIAAHHGRIVKRTGDGRIVEFRSVVDAVRCAIEVQNGLIERNAGVPAGKADRISASASSRRRRRGERRRSHGRRGQYRRAARGRRQAWGDLSFRKAYWQVKAARSQGQRSRRNETQEYRRAGPCLFGRGRQAQREAGAEG